MAKISHCTPITFVMASILLTAGIRVSAQVEGMQSFGNRVEGTNIHKNALQDFTLIALHRTFSAFPKDSNLHVRFFLPPLTKSLDKRVFIQAVELQDSFHYFMEANASTKWKDGDWNIFEPWPTRDIIDRLEIQPNNLGVLAGYRISNQQPVYIPVEVYPNEKQVTTTSYTLHFITGQDLQSLDVTVTNYTGAVVSVPMPKLRCNKSFNPSCKLYSAGSAQSFALNMSALPEGQYHVKLLGHVPGSLTPTSLDLVLYHRPR